MSKISQREARRLRKRVKELEEAEAKRQRRYAQDWPGGVNVATADLPTDAAVAIRTARRLRHAVVAIADDSGNSVRFMALQHPEIAGV